MPDPASKLSCFAVSVVLLAAAAARAAPADSPAPPTAPEWMWLRGPADRNNSVWFARQFTAEQPAAQLRLRWCSDDAEFSVYVDGRRLLDVDAYASWSERELVCRCEPGNHLIAIRAPRGELHDVAQLADVAVPITEGHQGVLGALGHDHSAVAHGA